MTPLTGLSGPFWKANGSYAICSTIGFLISVATGSHLHLDLIGTGAFAVAAIPGMLQQNAPIHVKWSSYAVFVWGAKLASFLFYRATQVGHDKRLEETLLTPNGSLQFWFITLVWNILCSMPYLLGMSSTTSGMNSDVKFLQAGGFVYLLGLFIETLADLQKWWFKNANPGKFCNIGLWSVSQHPNYLGNLILWLGILLMNVPWLIEPVGASPLISATSTQASVNFLFNAINKIWRCRKLVVALISPWFMWTLFSSQARGDVTNSVVLANSKYGNDPEYIKYVSQVPLIFPKIRRG
jgi:steroid 5-alpha reductase family enzyme